MSLYKMMNGTAGSCGYGNYTDYLPHGKRPGKWLPKQKPVLCVSGYHNCPDLKPAIIYAGDALYEVEVKGKQVHGDDKSASEQLRLVRRVPEWNERNQRLFAVDCARLVVHINPESSGLLNACLDVCVAYAEYGGEWAEAKDAASDAARAAAKDAQAGLLARYLSGEEGPLVEWSPNE